jgi:hypothetical protein
MSRMRHLLVVLGFCWLITACGSGGGGTGTGAGETPTTNGPGQRSVPGYTIAATRRSALVAGAPCTVRVTVTPESGQQAITAVEVWLGLNEYAAPASTTPATPVSGMATTWDVVTTLPNPLPADATVWLRLTTADGSVLEVGRDAFQLSTLPEG